MGKLFRGGMLCSAVPLFPALLLAAEAEAGGHAAAEKPLIHPTVWGILVFLTVLFILWKKAFPRILEALEKRAEMIREALQAAEKAKAEAQELLQKHEASLEKARYEARAIIEEGKTDAHRVREGIINDARTQTEELVARARREIELAKRAAVDDLHRQAVQLSTEIASKLIKKTLRPEDHQDLVRESIRKYQEAKRA